ncbi:hypothetical protein MUP56_01505 [Patescibacteria group bacterium]|nr:hypothetical protein [Patescibacteria group bacterium]
MKKIVRFIKIFFIALFVIFILLIIAWRIDRTFFHPYIPDFSDQIRSDVTTLKFTVPKDKEGCEEKGGTWKKLGPRPMEECNLPTSDGGKVCLGSNECEGVCLANISLDDIRKGMSGKLFKTNGKCSTWIKVLGCVGYVYRGWASVVCAD